MSDRSPVFHRPDVFPVAGHYSAQQAIVASLFEADGFAPSWEATRAQRVCAALFAVLTEDQQTRALQRLGWEVAQPAPFSDIKPDPARPGEVEYASWLAQLARVTSPAFEAPDIHPAPAFLFAKGARINSGQPLPSLIRQLHGAGLGPEEIAETLQRLGRDSEAEYFGSDIGTVIAAALSAGVGTCPDGVPVGVTPSAGEPSQ